MLHRPHSHGTVSKVGFGCPFSAGLANAKAALGPSVWSRTPVDGKAGLGHLKVPRLESDVGCLSGISKQ